MENSTQTIKVAKRQAFKGGFNAKACQSAGGSMDTHTRPEIILALYKHLVIEGKTLILQPLKEVTIMGALGLQFATELATVPKITFSYQDLSKIVDSEGNRITDGEIKEEQEGEETKSIGADEGFYSQVDADGNLIPPCILLTKSAFRMRDEDSYYYTLRDYKSYPEWKNFLSIFKCHQEDDKETLDFGKMDNFSKGIKAMDAGIITHDIDGKILEKYEDEEGAERMAIDIAKTKVAGYSKFRDNKLEIPARAKNITDEMYEAMMKVQLTEATIANYHLPQLTYVAELAIPTEEAVK